MDNGGARGARLIKGRGEERVLKGIEKKRGRRNQTQGGGKAKNE